MPKYDLDFATSLACLKQEMVPIYQVRQLCGEAANPGFLSNKKTHCNYFSSSWHMAKKANTTLTL